MIFFSFADLYSGAKGKRERRDTELPEKERGHRCIAATNLPTLLGRLREGGRGHHRAKRKEEKRKREKRKKKKKESKEIGGKRVFTP